MTRVDQQSYTQASDKLLHCVSVVACGCLLAQLLAMQTAANNMVFVACIDVTTPSYEGIVWRVLSI